MDKNRSTAYGVTKELDTTILTEHLQAAKHDAKI